MKAAAIESDLLLLHLATVACRTGIIECPSNGDVAMLKRLFQYQAHNKLLPALQVGIMCWYMFTGS